MSNISRLEFAALEVDGKNYMPWMVNVEMYLESLGLLDTIQENNNCSSLDKARANFILQKHIDSVLQLEYFNTRIPNVLWNDLKERFDLQRDVLLPAARHEWITLRFQDFQKVNHYSSALFRIRAKLRFCGQNVTEEEMLEKTYSTFHATNINLQQQYRNMKFKRYSDLNSNLLVAEQNNELLMKNHESRPTGSIALPEVNVAHNNGPRNNTRGRGRGRYDQSHPYDNNRNGGRGRGQRTNTYHAPQGDKAQPQNNPTSHDGIANTSQNTEGSCYRCGSMEHWAKACRAEPHLCKLYQASVKGKEKETNCIDQLDFQIPELNSPETFNEIE